jgi:hypothetical protein
MLERFDQKKLIDYGRNDGESFGNCEAEIIAPIPRHDDIIVNVWASPLKWSLAITGKRAINAEDCAKKIKIRISTAFMRSDEDTYI